MQDTVTDRGTVPVVPTHTIESFATPFAQPYSHTPGRAVSIDKTYVSPGTCCGWCGKGIASNLPAISLAVRASGEGAAETVRYLHDRCLGRALLDNLIENEGDAIGGFLFETIVNGAHA